MRPPLLDDPARRLHHHRERRLVVRAEDRATRVAHDPVVQHGLEVAVEGDGVEVGAEEDRHALDVSGQAAKDIPGRRADRRAASVLVPFEPDRVELADDPVGDRTLLAGRARDRAQLEKQVDDPRRQLRLLHGGHPTSRSRRGRGSAAVRRYAAVARTPERARLRSSAATTNSRKSGAGRVGRDLNSGWNWLATNHG